MREHSEKLQQELICAQQNEAQIDELRREIDKSHRENKILEKTNKLSEEACLLVKQQLRKIRQELVISQQQFFENQQKLSALQQQLFESQRQFSDYRERTQKQISEIFASKSWRLTRPIRAINKAIKSLSRRQSSNLSPTNNK